MNFNKSLLILFGFGLVLLFSLSFAMPVKAQSASLYLVPSSGNYTVGNTFLVQLKVNSGGVAINAADATLVFDPDKLEVLKLSKTDSVFTLWVQEPTFSNSVGTINFAGGKPSPGFTGAAGVIVNITFKGKTAGTANLTFAAGSVLADDGKGTNILTHMGTGSYNLTSRTITPLLPAEEEEYIPPVTPVAPGQRPAAPIVSSVTHPEENNWYSNNDPEFDWQLPGGVTKVSYAIDQKPTTNPKFIAPTLADKVSFENLEDGIWYFHINFRNSVGWGPLTHREVLIDTEPPEPFKIIADFEDDPFNPSPVLYFDTRDSLSGIEYYEVIIDGSEPEKVARIDLKENPYRLPAQPPGKHLIEVKAFDGAGNYVSAQTQIEISGIETPVITKFPKRLDINQNLNLEGESLPNVKIQIFFQPKGKEVIQEETIADGEGKWIFVSLKPLEKGEYSAWVRAQDQKGALSFPSPKISFKVDLPPLLKFGTIAIGYLTVMSTLLVLIAILVVIIFYSWYRISLWRKRLRKETSEVAQNVTRAFRALREEVQEQVEYLDKKPGLNKEEKRIRDKLQEALNVSEEFIGKEIKDVEKELE